MAQPKQSASSTDPTNSYSLERLLSLTQLDFELEFFGAILQRHPNNLEMLRVHAKNLASRKRFLESIQVERRIIQLCPKDSLAHYNLACSYALLQQIDLAITTLRLALELGYRDFDYIRKDRDLDSIRKDLRFRKLMREFETKR